MGLLAEIFDVVDYEGRPTGETVTREEAHEKGILHRTSHIWVISRNEGSLKVLLQKRSMEKDSFPGQYDTSSAGHIQAGDGPLESALRELHEELGIQAEEADLSFAGLFRINYVLEFHDKPFWDNEVTFVYVYDKAVDITKLTLQKEEVEEVRWFGIDEVYAGTINGDERFCVPMKGLLTLMNYLGYPEPVIEDN